MSVRKPEMRRVPAYFGGMPREARVKRLSGLREEVVMVWSVLKTKVEGYYNPSTSYLYFHFYFFILSAVCSCVLVACCTHGNKVAGRIGTACYDRCSVMCIPISSREISGTTTGVTANRHGAFTASTSASI